jgi:hypothetical protein
MVMLVLQRFLLDVMKLLDQVHYFHGVLQTVDCLALVTLLSIHVHVPSVHYCIFNRGRSLYT